MVVLVCEGFVEVTASVVDRKSVLSRMVHSSPLRGQPMPTASSRNAGAAAAVIASVGGGLLGDDSVSVRVRVEPGATLWLGTQSSTKIYKKRRAAFWQKEGEASKTTSKVDAEVCSGGVLVWAPDATMPYRGSRFMGSNRFVVAADASLVSVDWVQAGRSRMTSYGDQGERWVFDSFESRTTWRIEDGDAVDSVRLDASSRDAFDVGGIRRDVSAVVAFAGSGACGEAGERCRRLALFLAKRSGARVKKYEHIELSLSGFATLGVSTKGSLLVARLVAAEAEDAYRILHYCLKPLESVLGFQPYADRIHSATSLPFPLSSPAGRDEGKRASTADEEEKPFFAPSSIRGDCDDNLSSWLPSALMLGDSALPTGGFAHSCGLEAAFQLGIVKRGDEKALVKFVEASAHTHASLYAPFAKAAHEASGDSEILAMLDASLESLLDTHGPARLASRRQGAAIVRVAESLLGGDRACMKAEHGAVAFGSLASELGLPSLPASVVFAHSATRDAFSAAVRLNIVGPLRAIALQVRVLEKQTRHLTSVHDALDHEKAASTSPLVDAIHSAHHLFEMRLFQS